MSVRTVLRLALAGTRTDLLRIALTGLSVALATLAALAAATVLGIGFGDPQAGSAGWSTQYRSELLREPGLRPGLMFALVLLTVPVLALAAQCSRLGAPARERRLAALRLAGATPGQTIRIAAGETFVASALGAVVGLVVYFVLRSSLHRPDEGGLLPLPTDVRLPAWAYLLVCGGVPLIAAAVAALTLRKVAVEPLGVVRRTKASRPHWWPGILIGLGVAACLAFDVFSRQVRGEPVWVAPVLLFLGALLASLGTVLGVGWISWMTGRLLTRSRRPALLIAGRRLIADPWSGSRAMGALLAAVIFGAGALGYRSYAITGVELKLQAERAWAEANNEVWTSSVMDNFHVRAINLVNVAVNVALVLAALALVVAFTERIVARRRAYAALVAVGVPRRTVAWASLWQSLAPAAPAILLAVLVGTALVYAYGLDVVVPSRELASEQTVTRVAPVPIVDLAVFGVSALLLVLVMAGLSLTVLRASTDIGELRAG